MRASKFEGISHQLWKHIEDMVLLPENDDKKCGILILNVNRCLWFWYFSSTNIRLAVFDLRCKISNKKWFRKLLVEKIIGGVVACGFYARFCTVLRENEKLLAEKFS